jgi:hypothetical protein
MKSRDKGRKATRKPKVPEKVVGLGKGSAGVLEKFLERVFGKVHIYVTVGKRPAIEVIFEEPFIIIDVKNPLLAAEAGLDQMLKRRGTVTFDSKRLGGLKKMGYKIKVRFRGMEWEL